MDETWDLTWRSYLLNEVDIYWNLAHMQWLRRREHESDMYDPQTDQSEHKREIAWFNAKTKKLLVFNWQLIIVLQFFGLLDTIIWKCFNFRMLVVTVWPRIVKRNWFNQPRYFFFINDFSTLESIVHPNNTLHSLQLNFFTYSFRVQVVCEVNQQHNSLNSWLVKAIYMCMCM